MRVEARLDLQFVELSEGWSCGSSGGAQSAHVHPGPGRGGP